MSDVAAAKMGLFIADYKLTTGLMGAPSLLLKLTVNTPKQEVNGSARLTQPVSPPLDKRYAAHGAFTYMTVMPSNTHILVTLSGQEENKSAGSSIQAALLMDFELRMVLSEDWQSGTAIYKYRDGSQWKEITDVPVQLVKDQ